MGLTHNMGGFMGGNIVLCLGVLLDVLLGVCI